MLELVLQERLYLVVSVVETKAGQVIAKLSVLESDRSQWEGIFEDIRHYIYPITASFTSENPGDRALDRNRQIFDPTAERAHSDLVGALMGGLTNSSIRWGGYSLIDERLMQDLNIRRHLELATLQVLNIFASPGSNFYSAIHEFYYELTGLGTAVTFKRGKGSKSFFETVPLAEVFFEENERGQVDTIYRPMYLTPKQVLDQFKDIKSEVKDQLERSARNNSVLNKHKVIHCVRPRRERNKRKNNAKNKAFESLYILCDFGGHLLEESGYDRFPYYVTRWEKIPGREVYGRSPAMKALKDAKVLNKMNRTNLEAGEQIVTPAMQGPYDAYVGKIKLTPRAVNFYKVVMGIDDPTLKPINSIGNLPIGLEMEEQRRRAIEKSFFIDLLSEDKRARMTQLETAQNQQERLMKMAPQLLRIQTEYLNRLWLDLYEEILEEGLIDEPPSEMKHISITYNSPLVMAQKQAEIANISGFANTLSQYGQIFPDILLLPKAGELGREIAKVFNIPAASLNTQEEINAEKERQRQIAENEAAANQAKTLSEAGRNIAQIQGAGIDPASIF